MRYSTQRRKFLRNTTMMGIGIGLIPMHLPAIRAGLTDKGKRVGIIGLDTSHAVAFTKAMNQTKNPTLEGYTVVAAYPKGSLDIPSSVNRIPEYTEDVRKMGVEIVDSIGELLGKVDVVMLETNDGRRHLEQAIPVLKAGKTMFIDKPIAASLSDAIAIFDVADHYKVPVFSSSSLRFMESAQEVVNGKIGTVVGCDAYSPCPFEITHPDFFWYGIHGVELLYTIMGVGCKELIRVHTAGTDVAVGTWNDGRIGTFRGTRTGQHLYGGTAYGEKSNSILGPFEDYTPLLEEIIQFFKTGIPPVKEVDTIEIFTFMEAADESRLIEGGRVSLEEIWKRAQMVANQKLLRLL